MNFSSTISGFLLVVLSTFVTASTTSSQPPVTSYLWIRVWNYDPLNLSIMEFGNDINATYGLDDGTAGTVDLGEYVCPPTPPLALDVHWLAIPGRYCPGGLCVGCNRDYRPIPTNIAKKDTFKLLIDEWITPDSSIFLEWPDSSYLRVRCDSMFFVFTSSITGLNVTDMFKQHTLEISPAGAGLISSVFIYKYGVKLVDGVTEPPGFPLKTVLGQNYPNPFNPTTEIKFRIPEYSHVDLKVYDMLGREVATLLNENQQPGEHLVSWDAGRIASGIYYYRLTSLPLSRPGQPFVETKKMILQK